MKHYLFLALCLLFAVASAQTNRPGQMPPPQRYTVSFESQHGESFSVFIDGDLKNRMPQSRVIVNDIGGQTHEVVVVLKRPVEKAAVLSLRPGEPTVTVNVNYDMRLEQLYLYTPGHNRGDVDELAAYRNRDDARPAGTTIPRHLPPSRQAATSMTTPPRWPLTTMCWQ